MMTIEISPNRTTWTNISNRVTRAAHKITSRELETLEFTVANPSSAISVGMYVRAKRGTVTVFEGIIYEVRRQKSANVVEYDVRAYSELVLYDRHVVFRLYDTGTTAGAIIRDLASLEAGVNVTNVDDGPSLTSPWPIENVPALRVMLDVAKGTNHYIRMRPGRVLLFKPKAVGTPKLTLDETNVLSAEYAEDRWRLKNRVIYVGANGQVLADVSEPPGDLPVVVHDPFLTAPAEAQRRANIKLALNKEFGRQLRVVVPMRIVEDAGLDLFDTVRVNIIDLGLSNADLYVVEMSFDPLEKKYELTLGGRLELFEDYLSEALGGDVASRFGQKVSVAEALGSVSMQIEELRKRSHTLAQPTLYLLYLKPPLPYQNATNVFQDADGTLKLISGATSGTVDIPLRPLGSNDLYWRQLSYDIDQGGGSYSVSLLVSGRTLRSNAPNPYKFDYVVPRGSLAEGESGLWGATAGTTKEDVQVAVMTRFGLRFSNTSAFQVWYPSAKNWQVNLSEITYFMFWVYSNNDATIYVRLATNDANYFRANTTARAGRWVKNVIPLSSFSAVGSPSWSNINYLMFEFPAGTFHVDFDYVFAPVLNEQTTVRIALSRPTASVSSPIVKNIRLEYGDWLT
jgi:hypothetical protein